MARILRRAMVVAIPLSFIFAACSQSVFAQDTNSEELTQAFEEADLNADGYLSIDEYVAYLVGIFATKDLNRDGFLSPSEIPNVSGERFSKADRDEDGQISLGEGMGSKVIDFFDADLNRDGTMDLGELLMIEQRLASQ